MAENGTGVFDEGRAFEKLVERLDEAEDLKGDDASDVPAEVEQSESLLLEERIAEDVYGEVENPPVIPSAAYESENIEEIFETPRQGIENSAFGGFPQCSGPNPMDEDVPAMNTGGGELDAFLIDEDGEHIVKDGRSESKDCAVETNDHQDGNADPKEEFLMADSTGVVNYPPLHTIDIHRKVSDVSLDGKFVDAELGESPGAGDSDEHSVVNLENFEGVDDQELKLHAVNQQVSNNEISHSNADGDDKSREAFGLPHEDAASGTEKTDLTGSVESSQDDHVTVVSEEEEEEEEEEIGNLSMEEVIRQFLSSDEPQGDHEFEEDSTLNGILETPRYELEVTSDYSSEGEKTQSVQSKSIELDNQGEKPSLNDKDSSATPLIGSFGESSTALPLPPVRPSGIDSSASLLKSVSVTQQPAKSDGNAPAQNPTLYENGNSLNHADSFSGEFVTIETSPTMKLDQRETSIGFEADGKPTVTTGDKSCAKTMANYSSGSSSDSPEPPSRPAGLGSSASLLDPAPRSQQQPRTNGAIPPMRPQVTEEAVNGDAGEDNETRDKLQMIRVKFLRLARRLGQTPHNPVVAQVLYRLGLAEQLRGSRAGSFSFDRASALAEQLEASGEDDLDFACTIMVLGKTGVGKSATINSIFDEAMFTTDAFQMGTKKVQSVVGTVQGIKVRVIDTPGLLSSILDQRKNEKILHSVKSFIKKTPPDIVLYLDRLDMQTRDYGDLPLLRTITDIFGPAIWFNAIVVFSHAASAPPEGPNGTLTYDMYVAQRSHVVQQAIRQAAGDMRLMNPVSLVENHLACRTNRAGQRVLPNGQVWKPHLLLLSFASKILAEANTLLKLQTNPPGKPFGTRTRAPPLPFLLSSLLQSRPQVRLPEEQFGDEDSIDDDLDDSSDTDDENEYDELPPFKRLTKRQISKLNKEQRKAYFDELDYREKLFMKKQFKEEKMRRKLLKKMAASDKWNDGYNENMEEESGGAASVPVPMPDMALPASFDSDNPTHRYRYLDTVNQWLVRPVLEFHGWDHDVGYEGLNVERLFVIRDKIPVSFSGQITKDKKEANLQLECASSIKHGEGKSTSLGLDMQTVGKDIAYTLRGETRISSHKCNKAGAGLSVTLLGDALSAGLKVEDKLIVNKRLKVVLNGGAMAGRGDIAYGGSLEATIRDKDYPIGRMLSTLSLSLVDWHGDLALGCNLQSHIPVGRGTNMIARANLNNRGSGQVSIRLNTSEQIHVALLGLLPVVRNIIRNRLFDPQPMQ